MLLVELSVNTLPVLVALASLIAVITAVHYYKFGLSKFVMTPILGFVATVGVFVNASLFKFGDFTKYSGIVDPCYFISLVLLVIYALAIATIAIILRRRAALSVDDKQ